MILITACKSISEALKCSGTVADDCVPGRGRQESSGVECPAVICTRSGEPLG